MEGYDIESPPSDESSASIARDVDFVHLATEDECAYASAN